MLRTLLALVTLLLGLALLGGGIWLISLGGAWGYLPLGALLATSGALLLARRRLGLLFYALAILFQLGWGWLEVGFDWWALAPRDGLIFVLGLALLLPPVTRSLRNGKVNAGGGTEGRVDTGAQEPTAPGSRHKLALVGSLGVATIVAIIALLSDPHGIDNRFADDRMAAVATPDPDVADGDWASYGRTADGQRFSPLDQITPANVADLEVAWEYHAGDIHPDLPGTALESTPLIVGDTLYLCTPRSEVIALDPVSGEERWRFDPNLIELSKKLSTYTTCRGLSYHDVSAEGWPVSDEPLPDAERAQALLQASVDEVTSAAAGVSQNIVAGTAQAGDPNPVIIARQGDPEAPVRADCLQRIFLPTRDARLIALSAETGTICPGFGGDDGSVNLWQNMPNVTPSAYYSTSPPTVAGDVIVVGGGVNDNVSTELPSGVIRGFDLRTGELRWNFDPGNPTETAPIGPDETYVQNVPNS